MMDRARYLRDANWEAPLASFSPAIHNFTYAPRGRRALLDMQILLADGAAQARLNGGSPTTSRGRADDVLRPARSP